ncbi:hypothetical protein ACWEN6_13705 [Sphaerisporangium sp. NPDC004334]
MTDHTDQLSEIAETTAELSRLGDLTRAHKQGRKQAPDVARRARALGMKVEEIALLLDVTRKTVSEWTGD